MEEEKFGLNQTTRSGSSKGPAVPALPQHLIGQGETNIRLCNVHGDLLTRGYLHAVHDGNLKNLLMSWYYAGYYTGLYEGQQGVVEKDAKH